jgi:hypothetical protein
MGLLKAMHRRTWKIAVGDEFLRQHGIPFRTLANIIGPATLDDLLNDRYEDAPGTPAVAAADLARVLTRSCGINIPLLAMRCKIETAQWGKAS